jgi:crotonobetainyl-CoA:carnitine CoA-transferase CaiB-like acyl-CoA transferase
VSATESNPDANLLEGVRVLDLSRMLAGPYGSMLLADMGAEVVKIEVPGRGDPIRAMGPPFQQGESAYFLGINRNKRSVTLDLHQEQGRELFLELVAKSDVVFDNFRPGVMRRLGLEHSDLVRVRPDLITCSITAFGPDGPYVEQPAFDLTLQALGGGMSLTGHPGGAPARMGLPIGDLGGGMFAAQAISAALFRRERTGQGRHIDLALLDIQVSLLTYIAQYHFADGRVPRLMGTGHESVVPYQAFDTATSQIVVAVFVNDFWRGLCEVLGLEHLYEQYPSALERLTVRDVIVGEVAARLRTAPAADWIEKLWARGVPSAPVNSVDQVLRDPQVLHRDMVVRTGPHPVVGEYATLGNPVKVGQHQTFEPAPLLGEGNADYLIGLLGHDAADLAKWSADGVV